MKMLLGRHRLMLVLAGAVLLAASGGVAFATIPSSSGVIHGCFGSSGLLRVVDEADSCHASETEISWSQVGPTGPQGPPGEPGPQGQPGAAGAASTPLAYAHILADGTIDVERSSTNVLAVSRSTVAGTAGLFPLYCFQLGVTAKNIVVTVEDSRMPVPPGPPGFPSPFPPGTTVTFASNDVNASAQPSLAFDFGCENGTEAAVAFTGSRTAGPFYVTLN